MGMKMIYKDTSFDWTLVLAWFVCLISIQTTGAIDCYDCPSISNLTDCHTVKYCAQQKYCLQIYNRVNNTYTLRCASDSECQPDSTTIVTTALPPTHTPGALTTSIYFNVTQMTSTDYNLTDTTTNNISTNSTTTATAAATTTTTTPTAAFSYTTRPNVSATLRPDPALRVADTEMFCCEKDSCNKHVRDITTTISPTFHIPTTPNNTVCHDQPGFDCYTAQQYFNVCDDIQKAKRICKKHCNLCDLVDGNWSEWGNWSECGVTCGNGTKWRSRECNNPAPFDRGDNCTGSDMDSDYCNDRDCPVDGSWAQWTNWTDCSVTCGVGLQKRYRNCSHPYPEADGLFCLGASSDDQICYKSPCYDGFWQSWSAWGECSHTCGSGLKTRTRNCSSEYGHMCLGDSFEADTCIEKECAGSTNIFNIGQWNDWLPWRSCSATCGVALKSRARSCSGTVCTGSYQEFDTCTLDDCPEPMSAFLVDGVAIEGPENRTLILTHVITNVGNDYDNSTGQFHCRIPGLYSFSVSIEKSPDVSEAFCHLMKNNSTTIFVGSRSAFYHDKTYQQASNSGILELKRGDIVYLGKCTTPVTFTEKSTFSGTLLVAKSDDS